MKIVKSSSREEWLEQRRKVITATDIARLHLGGPKTWQRIREEKAGKETSFNGNKATEWGKQREPHISSYVTVFVDTSLAHNEYLVVSDKDERFAATPDMIGDGVLGEIKTTKHDFDTIPDNYFIQMQWQMLVCDFDTCVFAWEPHTDYAPGQIKHSVVRADKKLQAELISTALRFLEGDAPDAGNEQAGWNALIAEYKAAYALEQEAKASLDAVKQRMREYAGGEDMKFSSDQGAVTIFTPKPSARFDSTLFKKEHPELHAKYVKRGKSSTQQIKVTLPKE